MDTIIKSETAARIADLADRLGCAGPDATELVLQMALDDLDAKTPRPQRKFTPAEIAAEMEYWAEVGRRNRALHPFDDANPPSKVWQDELYGGYNRPSALGYNGLRDRNCRTIGQGENYGYRHQTRNLRPY